MIVHVLYSGTLFSVTKKSYEKLEFETDIKLEELINCLVIIYGEKFDDSIFEKDMGTLKVPIFSSGKKLDLNDIIKNEDRIIFSFAVLGG